MMSVGTNGSDKRARHARTRRLAGQSSPRSKRQRSDTSRKERSARSGGGSYFASKRRVLRFVGLLVLFMVGFNALFYVWISPAESFQEYLTLNAEASAVILRLLGDDATAAGVSVGSSRFSVNIKRGCDALQVSAFFIFAVLAWPVSVSIWRRFLGLIIGTSLLLAMNLVRIVSLYYTGIHFPSAFDMMHIDVWQVGFIVLALFFWVLWLWWVARAEMGKPHVVG